MSYETHDLPKSVDRSDPLSLFQNLPTLELSAQDLADMKRSVHEMRRAKAIEAESTAATPPRRAGLRAGAWTAAFGRFADVSHALRVAAAFVLLIGASSLLPSLGFQPMQVAQLDAAANYRGVYDRVYSGPSRAEREAADALPLVENVLGEPELIQIEDSEMSLVVAAIQ